MVAAVRDEATGRDLFPSGQDDAREEAPDGGPGVATRPGDRPGGEGLLPAPARRLCRGAGQGGDTRDPHVLGLPHRCLRLEAEEAGRSPLSRLSQPGPAAAFLRGGTAAEPAPAPAVYLDVVPLTRRP